MPAQVVEKIQAFNQGRIPELLHRKYRKMKEDSFSFFRGTCHLFYEDWPQHHSLNDAPLTWICGDLHLENFGTYKGNNRLVYFDINDFDEAILAPCTWDITRLITSVIVGAKSLNIDTSDALDLARHGLESYRQALLSGKALWLEHDISTGLIQDLMDKVTTRQREDLFKKYQVKDNQFDFSAQNESSKHVLPIQPKDRKFVESLLQQFVDQNNLTKDITLLDIAFRVAGNSSLGIPRYILLVKIGDKLRLLDIKQSRPASLRPYLQTAQPNWLSEAHRIVNIQCRLQAIAPALLTPLVYQNQSYVLRELQPSEDKVDLKKVSLKEQSEVIQAMAATAAWDHLRGSGQQSSAIVDALREFAQQIIWQEKVLDYAKTYSQKVESDWQEWQRFWKDSPQA